MAQSVRIYVQSRGISQESDYRWLKIEEDEQKPEIPTILKRAIVIDSQPQIQVSDLIDSQTHSIVLARSNDELLLLVTGLKTREERTDFMGRKVRNSVAYVCQYSKYSDDNELTIRSLAVRALRGDLEDVIDKAVNIGGEYGFEVSFKEISQLARPKEVKSLKAQQQIRIGGNSPEFKQKLADELEQHCLPKTDRLLVVVTGIKSKDALIQAKVWRGLSSRVKTQDWIEISDATVNLAANTLESEQHQQKKTPSWTKVLIAVSVFTLIVVILLAIRWWQTSPKPEPKPEAWHPPMILSVEESQQWLNQESFSTNGISTAL